MGINDAGTKLAALTATKLYIWNLASGDNKPMVLDAAMVGNPFSARLAWVDDDHLMVGGFDGHVLFRLSWELPVWSYTMDVRETFLNRDPLFSQVLNSHFFYVAQPDVRGVNIALGAVKLPGPSVDSITAKIDREQLFVVKPGTSVTIGELNVTDSEKVRGWLTDKIRQCGWIMDNRSSIAIHCEMGLGEQQTETYRSFGVRSSDTTVTYTPHFSKLTIRQGDTVLWRGGTSTGAPLVVHGSDIQSQIDSQQHPQLQFFERVELPARILDPKYGSGFGVSKLGLRGIEVISTTPPGRAADPDAAERKSKEDQQRARNQGSNGSASQEGFSRG